MKKIISLSILFNLYQLCSTAQNNYVYWVMFKDKNNSAYTINKPSSYLSEKAIVRRNNQHIAISESDLPVNANYVYGVKNAGVTILNKSKWFNAVTVSTGDTSLLARISQLPYVKNIILLSSPSIKTATPKYKDECNSLKSISENKSVTATENNVFNYGLSTNQVQQIGVNCLHNRGYQGQGMTIAYMDDGFYKADSFPAFDSLRVNNQILGGYNFVAGNTDLYVHQDVNLSHGMMTFSCSGANLPGHIIGTAPKAKFWLFVTENYYSESWQEETNWAVAAEFADSVGVDVINSSLGYSINMTNPAQNHTYSEMDGRTTIISKAAVLAARKGMLVTSSAGNSGGAPWYKITAPADADSILTVGAVDSLGFIAGFSSRGPTFDGRIKPNTCARGVNAAVASTTGQVWAESGTSFSSPITAGAVACLWQAHPTATNMQVLYAIERSASQYFAPDTIKGFGIPNFCTADSILETITGISEIQKNSDDNISVYPNPFNSGFTISFYSETKQNIQIELYDIAGRRIYNQNKKANANANLFNIEDEAAINKGVYLLRLITTDKIYYKKLVKE